MNSSFAVLARRSAAAATESGAQTAGQAKAMAGDPRRAAASTSGPSGSLTLPGLSPSQGTEIGLWIPALKVEVTDSSGATKHIEAGPTLNLDYEHDEHGLQFQLDAGVSVMDGEEELEGGLTLGHDQRADRNGTGGGQFGVDAGAYVEGNNARLELGWTANVDQQESADGSQLGLDGGMFLQAGERTEFGGTINLDQSEIPGGGGQQTMLDAGLFAENDSGVRQEGGLTVGYQDFDNGGGIFVGSYAEDENGRTQNGIGASVTQSSDEVTLAVGGELPFGGPTFQGSVTIDLGRGEEIAEEIGAFGAAVVGAVSDVVTATADTVGKLQEVVGDATDEAIDAAQEAAEKAAAAAEAAAEAAAQAAADAAEAAAAAAQDAGEAVNDAAEAAGEAAGDVADAAADLFNGLFGG
ncbi:MAG: hypothetical protein AAF628_33320 [Planctomycetota bacterium]